MLVLIAVSMGIHMMLFAHIAGLYRSRLVSYIELTLQDISKPYVRSIPRPRIRHRNPPIQQIQQQNVPKYVPYMKMDQVYQDSKGTGEQISMPEIPEAALPGRVDWAPVPAFGNTGAFDTISEYFDMVKLRIESKKQYPREAMRREIQGRTTVLFMISRNGSISMIKIQKSSGNRALDEAAHKAVQSASPLPVPPSRLFKNKKQIRLAVTIVFELT